MHIVDCSVRFHSVCPQYTAYVDTACVSLLLTIYNSTVLCTVEFIGHFLSDRESTSCKGMGAGEMGITNGNENGMAIKLG